MSKSTLEKDKGKHDYATKTHEGFFFFFIFVYSYEVTEMHCLSGMTSL